MITLYHSLVAALLGLYVGAAWLLLGLFGRGVGLGRTLSLGPMYLSMTLLIALTILFLPAIVFCGMRAWQRSSRNPDRFRRFVSLPTLARVFSLQGVLFFALLLGLETPWARILKTDWKAVARGLVTTPAPRALPSDDSIGFPELPLSSRDPFAWTVTDLDGNATPMASLVGKPLFVNFWATWCPPCRAELPNIQRLYESLTDADAAVLLISNEEPETVKPFLDENGYTFPCYLSEDDPPFPFAVSSIPATFIVAPDGAIAFHHVGPVAWDGGRTREFLIGLAGAAEVAPAPDASVAEPVIPAPSTAELAVSPNS